MSGCYNRVWATKYQLQVLEGIFFHNAVEAGRDEYLPIDIVLVDGKWYFKGYEPEGQNGAQEEADEDGGRDAGTSRG